MDALDREILFAFGRMVIFLLILAPAVYGLTRWYGLRTYSRSSIRVKERVGLGGNRGLYVVEWAGKELLLGVTGHQISVLHSRITEGLEQPAPGEGVD